MNMNEITNMETSSRQAILNDIYFNFLHLVKIYATKDNVDTV